MFKQLFSCLGKKRDVAYLIFKKKFLIVTAKSFWGNFEIVPNILKLSHKKNCMQNLIFYVHNVVMDTKKIEVFPFLCLNFSKNAQKLIFF